MSDPNATRLAVGRPVAGGPRVSDVRVLRRLGDP